LRNEKLLLRRNIGAARLEIILAFFARLGAPSKGAEGGWT